MKYFNLENMQKTILRYFVLNKNVSKSTFGNIKFKWKFWVTLINVIFSNTSSIWISKGWPKIWHCEKKNHIPKTKTYIYSVIYRKVKQVNFLIISKIGTSYCTCTIHTYCNREVHFYSLEKLKLVWKWKCQN